MLSSDFLFPRFFVVPLANPSNFSHCKCFSSRIYYGFTTLSTASSMSLELELKVVVSLSAILRHKEGPGIHQLRIMHEEFDYLP